MPIPFSSQLRRGVHVAPWMGPDGELVLLAITSACKLVAPPVVVPHGADRIAAADELWERLDREDPERRKIMRAI